MKNLIFDVETTLINLFQTGFASVNDSGIKQLEQTAQSCSRHNLTLLADEISALAVLLAKEKNSDNLLVITQKTLHITRCVNILKQKISYDELGGY